MEHNFEAAAEFLLKCCTKKALSKSQNSHRISAVKNTGKRRHDNNCEKGSTDVSLRYHIKKEYLKIMPEQKKELKEWRESQQKVKKQNIAAVQSLKGRSTNL